MYLWLSDDPAVIKKDMLRFGWDLEELERQSKLAIVDLTAMVHMSREEFKKTVYGIEVPKFLIEAVTTAVKK